MVQHLQSHNCRYNQIHALFLDCTYCHESDLMAQLIIFFFGDNLSVTALPDPYSLCGL